MEFFTKFKDDFVLNFLDDSKWKWLVDGLKNTLIITFFALLLGVAVGIVIAIIRSTFDKNRESYRKRKNGLLWCQFRKYSRKAYRKVHDLRLRK